MKKPIMTQIGALFTGAIMLSAVSAAQAAIIDFESLQHIDNLVLTQGFSYSEDGFTFTDVTANNGFVTFGTLEGRFTGSTALINNANNGLTRLEKTVGSNRFNISSIDLAELNGNQNPGAIATFTGFFFGGGTIVQAFQLDGNAFGAETFNFVNFNDIVKLEWGQITPFHQFDNLNVVPAVPLPAALPLFLSALAGLGLMGWRRQQAGA